MSAPLRPSLRRAALESSSALLLAQRPLPPPPPNFPLEDANSVPVSDIENVTESGSSTPYGLIAGMCVLGVACAIALFYRKRLYKLFVLLFDFDNRKNADKKKKDASM